MFILHISIPKQHSFVLKIFELYILASCLYYFATLFFTLHCEIHPYCCRQLQLVHFYCCISVSSYDSVTICPFWFDGHSGCLSEKAMAPHSSTLAWKIPWMEEPGGLQSMGSLTRTWLSDFTFTFRFHALEKEMATHSSVLAWRIPGTGEPAGLPSMGSHRVGHDWSDLAIAIAGCL